jgi:uncharacterized protein (TIRG00374 family)
VKYLRPLIGALLGALFIWLLVRRLDFAELARSFRQIRYPLIVPSLLLALLGFVARAYRWRYLFSRDEHIRFRKLYTATMIGFMGNALLPARAGEFIRAYVISKAKNKLAVSKAFATIVSERLFDGAVLILLLCFTLLVLPSDKPVVIPEGTFFDSSVVLTQTHLLRMAAIACAVLAVAAGFVFLIYLKGESVARAIGRATPAVFQKLAEHLTRLTISFTSGFDVVRDRRRLVTVGLLSLLVWAPAAFAVYPMLHAFPEDIQWPWYTPIVVLTIVCVGLMIPAAPGFVGTFHAFCVAALLLCAPAPIGFDSAVAFSVVYHGATMIALVVVGLICLWVENLSLVEVTRSAQRSGE